MMLNRRALKEILFPPDLQGKSSPCPWDCGTEGALPVLGRMEDRESMVKKWSELCLSILEDVPEGHGAIQRDLDNHGKWAMGIL